MKMASSRDRAAASRRRRSRAGMVTLTWTSMNIDSYKAHVHHGLKRLEQLVTGINDVIEHRIENNLKVVSRTRLVDLPDDQSFTVDDFVHNQHDHIEVEVDVLTGKNLEIEAAVDDLVQVSPASLLRRRRASPSPQHAVGTFLGDFEAIRTASGPLRRVRGSAVLRWREVLAPTPRRRRRDAVVMIVRERTVSRRCPCHTGSCAPSSSTRIVCMSARSRSGRRRS